MWPWIAIGNTSIGCVSPALFMQLLPAGGRDVCLVVRAGILSVNET